MENVCVTKYWECAINAFTFKRYVCYGEWNLKNAIKKLAMYTGGDIIYTYLDVWSILRYTMRFHCLNILTKEWKGGFGTCNIVYNIENEFENEGL